MKEVVTAKNKNGQKEEKSSISISLTAASMASYRSYILALVSCYRSTTECCATIVHENKMAGRVVTILKILAQLKGLQ